MAIDSRHYTNRVSSLRSHHTKHKKKLLNTFLTVQSIILASCIITYFLALKIKFINVSLYNTGDRTRYTFFFLQPNNFGIQFAFTIICFIYISKLSSPISIAILAISSAFLYIFPNCVTGCVVLVIYALLILFFDKIDFSKENTTICTISCCNYRHPHFLLIPHREDRLHRKNHLRHIFV